jgi:hypothetical protein
MSSDALPDDPGTLKAMLLAERTQNERLRQIISIPPGWAALLSCRYRARI